MDFNSWDSGWIHVNFDLQLHDDIVKSWPHFNNSLSPKSIGSYDYFATT